MGGSSVERAEAVMDQAGERVGTVVHAVGARLRRVAALAREEAEDVLAEAQTLRHGDSTDNR
jgi:hypothetical protein